MLLPGVLLSKSRLFLLPYYGCCQTSKSEAESEANSAGWGNTRDEVTSRACVHSKGRFYLYLETEPLLVGMDSSIHQLRVRKHQKGHLPDAQRNRGSHRTTSGKNWVLTLKVLTSQGKSREADTSHNAKCSRAIIKRNNNKRIR